LRVDGCLVLMAALAGAAVGLADLVRGRTLAVRACGALALFAILPNPGVAPLLPLALLAPILLQRRAPSAQSSDPDRWPRLARALVVVAAFGGAATAVASQFDAPHRFFAEQQRVAAWLKSSTPVQSKVLIPAAARRSGFEVIRLLSERQVWVDWKSGAAVMWRPDVYAIWRQRMDETAALKTVDEAAAYACGRGIRYLIEDPPALEPRHPGRTVYDDGVSAVVDLAGDCPAATAAPVS
jgi:hypothetical protein